MCVCALWSLLHSVDFLSGKLAGKKQQYGEQDECPGCKLNDMEREIERGSVYTHLCLLYNLCKRYIVLHCGRLYNNSCK